MFGIQQKLRHIKGVNCVVRLLDGEEKEKGIEEIFEATVTDSFPKLMIDPKPQIQESQRTLSNLSTKKITPRDILFKLQKIQDKVLKEARGVKHPLYRGARIRIISDVSSEPSKQQKSGVKYLKD